MAQQGEAQGVKTPAERDERAGAVQKGIDALRATIPMDATLAEMRDALLMGGGVASDVAEEAAMRRYGELDDQADEIARRELENGVGFSVGGLASLLREQYRIMPARANDSARRVLQARRLGAKVTGSIRSTPLDLAIAEVARLQAEHLREQTRYWTATAEADLARRNANALHDKVMEATVKAEEAAHAQVEEAGR